MFLVKRGATSVILPLFVRHSTTGAGLASIAYNESGLTCYYHRSSAASPVAITLVSGTAGTFTSSGWVAVDNSAMPGDYQIGVPNAALLTGADIVVIHCKGVANMSPTRVLVKLVNFDLDTSAQNVIVQSNLDKTGYSLASSQTFNTSGSVGSVTAGVTVTTNNDKTGYRIAGTKNTLDQLNDVDVDDIWNVQLENWPTEGSAGMYLDITKHYVGNKWILDPKTNRYSLKKDDGTTEYESGTSKGTERSPNR